MNALEDMKENYLYNKKLNQICESIKKNTDTTIDQKVSAILMASLISKNKLEVVDI